MAPPSPSPANTPDARVRWGVIFGRVKHGLRWRVRRWLRLRDQPRGFYPAACVRRQTVEFSYLGREYVVESDFRTPLYETVAEIADYDCYQLERIAPSLSVGAVIIDAGANVGVASVVLAARFGCRVLALEPVPENYAWLQENLRRNELPRVEPLLRGLAGDDRQDRLWQDPQQSVSAHFNPLVSVERPAGLRPVEAEFVSLKTLLRTANVPSVALLKLDIEGGEHEVLASLDAELSARIDAITLEVHDRGQGRDLRAVSSRLSGLGYNIAIKPHRGVGRGLHYLCAQRRSGR